MRGTDTVNRSRPLKVCSLSHAILLSWIYLKLSCQNKSEEVNTWIKLLCVSHKKDCPTLAAYPLYYSRVNLQPVTLNNSHTILYRRDSSSGRASSSCAVGQDGCRIDTWPRHTKDVIKMVPVATLLGAQHYKASTGFSSLTNHASLTSHNYPKKKKINK